MGQIFFFVFSCVCKGEQEGAGPCCQTTPTVSDRGHTFDEALKTTMWGNCSEGIT